MSVTNTPAGSASIVLALSNLLSGDASGQELCPSISLGYSFAATEALPIMGCAGWLYGRPVCQAGNWSIASATNPFGAMGNMLYSRNLAPGGKVVKLFYVRNLDPTNSVTLTRAATNGCPLFNAASAGIVIPAGGMFLFIDPTGTTIPALTTGTNDAITIAVSAGTPQVEVLIAYK